MKTRNILPRHSELVSESSALSVKIGRSRNNPPWRTEITNLYGFTLVELIVVITILVILGTIGFLSLQGHQGSARDSDRISSLALLQKWLDISYVKIGQYPIPDGTVSTGSLGGITLAYVGEVQNHISSLAGISKTPTDPLSGNFYAYGTDASNKYYQIATALENPTAYNPIVSSVYADNGVAARVSGNYDGLLINGGNIYNLPSLVFAWSGELSSTGAVHFIVDKQPNLPYKVGDVANLTPRETSEVLRTLTNGGTQTLAWVATPKSMQELTDRSEFIAQLGYPLNTIGTKVLQGNYVPTPTETLGSCLLGDGTSTGSMVGSCSL